jgi:hypothetical protein
MIIGRFDFDRSEQHYFWKRCARHRRNPVAPTFSANRDRLFSEAMTQRFFVQVLRIAEWPDLIPDEHADPDTRPYKKGDGDKSCMAYLGHALMENRHCLVVDAETTLATGTAECGPAP